MTHPAGGSSRGSGHHQEWGGERRNCKACSGEVGVLRQRRLALLSRGNRAGLKELPALCVGGGTDRQPAAEGRSCCAYGGFCPEGKKV